MVARDAEWMHNDPEHSDCDRMNADSHLRALLLGHSLTLQVSGGEVVLGQWQRILMAELDGPRARSLRVPGLQASSRRFAMRRASRRRRPHRHRRQARRRRAPRRSTTACGCSTVPICWRVGWLANREREKRHGARTYYNYNIRLEATNVCVASCLFCSFARLKPGDPGAYTMSLEEAWDKLRQRAHQPLTEVHVVNGLHPDLPFDYYTELLRGFKRIRPDIHLKCFTAVEIAFFADLYGMTDEQVLRELMAAGLDSLPGGGAEIFAERVRQKICARQVRHRSLSRHPPHRASARACART